MHTFAVLSLPDSSLRYCDFDSDLPRDQRREERRGTREELFSISASRRFL
jgi:hypothetical protein